MDTNVSHPTLDAEPLLPLSPSIPAPIPAVAFVPFIQTLSPRKKFPAASRLREYPQYADGL